MNNLYESRGKVPVDGTKEAAGNEAVNRLIERNRQSRERSAQILDYYKNRQRMAQE